MSFDFSGYALITDVDGTLLNTEHEISEKNMQAIREFTTNGGFFTLATGRGLSMAKPIAEQLGLKCPAILFNGASIYDYATDSQLWCSILARRNIDCLQKIMDKFPTCAVEMLHSDGNVYLLSTNTLEEQQLVLGDVTPVRCSLGEAPYDGYLKALVVDEPETIDKIIKYVMDNSFDDVHWVRSSPVYYEMLPKNANKGMAMLKLLELTGNKERFTIGVGDFMNDLELILFADFGVAVGNAEEIVKNAADLVSVDNNNDAIFAVIEYIKNNGGFDGHRIEKAVAGNCN